MKLVEEGVMKNTVFDLSRFKKVRYETIEEYLEKVWYEYSFPPIEWPDIPLETGGVDFGWRNKAIYEKYKFSNLLDAISPNRICQIIENIKTQDNLRNYTSVSIPGAADTNDITEYLNKINEDCFYFNLFEPIGNLFKHKD